MLKDFTEKKLRSRVRGIPLCPVAKEPQTSWKAGTSENCWWWERQTPLEEWTGSYAMNGWFYTEKIILGGAQNRFESEASVKNTVTTPVFADAVWPDVWPRTNDTFIDNVYLGWQGGAGYENIPIQMGRMVITRHGSKPSNGGKGSWPLDQTATASLGRQRQFRRWSCAAGEVARPLVSHLAQELEPISNHEAIFLGRVLKSSSRGDEALIFRRS